MKRLLLCSSAFFLFNSVFAQDFKSQQKVTVQQIESTNWSFPTIENYDGSYQFIVRSKKQFLITTETLELIAASRKDHEDVVLSLSPYLDVEILSQDTVNNSNFSGFQTTFIIK